jgi:hypothetical protein
VKKLFWLLYVLVPLAVALGLRLYPTLTTGMPFSTDGWPIIRNTELIIKNTPVPLNSNIFDGYDNFMPASSLFSAILSEVTGVAPMNVTALAMPIVGALAIPIFYVLVNRITRNASVSLVASILLATAFPCTMFTAGVTKETYASPLYILLILLFLLKHDWKTTVLFLTVSAALVLSHQVTAFLTLAVLTLLSVGFCVSRADAEPKRNSNKSNFLYVGILSTVAGLYFGLYANAALIVTVTPSDLLTLGAYVILITAATLYLLLKPVKPAKTHVTALLKYAVSFLVPAGIVFLSTRIPLVPGAPKLPLHYFVYATPFLIAGPLIVYGLSGLRKNNFSLLIPVLWFTAILSPAVYLVFADVPSETVSVYRFLDFLLPPMIILMAASLGKVYNSKPRRFHTDKIAKFAAVALIAIITATSTFSLYAAVSLQEPYLGYFWSYQPSEYAASSWIAQRCGNQTVTGDAKTQYLLSGYFNVKVSVWPGLDFLAGNGRDPSILYVYNEMKTNGYVLYGGTVAPLPENWTDKLTDLNVVYTNNEVTIYLAR